MAQTFDLQWLIAEGRAHWKRHLPRMYARLKNNGTLESSLQDAARQTKLIMDQYEQTGMTPAAAWPEARADYLILDPKQYNTK